MNPPWINYGNMNEIKTKQTAVYRTSQGSTVQGQKEREQLVTHKEEELYDEEAQTLTNCPPSIEIKDRFLKYKGFTFTKRKHRHRKYMVPELNRTPGENEEEFDECLQEEHEVKQTEEHSDANIGEQANSSSEEVNKQNLKESITERTEDEEVPSKRKEHSEHQTEKETAIEKVEQHPFNFREEAVQKPQKEEKSGHSLKGKEEKEPVKEKAREKEVEHVVKEKMKEQVKEKEREKEEEVEHVVKEKMKEQVKEKEREKKEEAQQLVKEQIKERAKENVIKKKEEISNLVKQDEKAEQIKKELYKKGEEKALNLPEENDVLEEVENETSPQITQQEKERLLVKGDDEETMAPEEAGEVYVKTLNIPFSSFIQIDQFYHLPIFGQQMEQIFSFIVEDQQDIPHLESKFFETITYYHEPPYGRFISSKVYEMMCWVKEAEAPAIDEERNEKRPLIKAEGGPVWKSVKEQEMNELFPSISHPVKMKIPVVLGDYKMEMCLEEVTEFEEGAVHILDVSKDIVLTRCQFVPGDFSACIKSGDKMAVKGTLFVEGHVHEQIEYTPIADCENESQDEEDPDVLRLRQNIVIELIIRLLQEQLYI